MTLRGHPDKVCDQIVGAILDACLKKDPYSRVAIDCIIKNKTVYLVGELNTKARIKPKEIARRVLRDIGYSEHYHVHEQFSKQTSAIYKAIKMGTSGDTAVCIGYASNDTSDFLPTAQVILIRFAREYDRLASERPKLYRPDGKAVITGIYDDEGKLITIKTFTIVYHNLERFRPATDRELVDVARGLCNYYQVHVQEFLINPAGPFKVGGFKADSGISGRKQNVDAYHTFAIATGSMNGKDPTKPDVCGNYKARDLAKRYLSQYHLTWCRVQITYAIGRSVPLAINVTSNEGDIEIGSEVYKECTPKEIIKSLRLINIDYEERARYGHFARMPKFSKKKGENEEYDYIETTIETN